MELCSGDVFGVSTSPIGVGLIEVSGVALPSKDAIG